ncbi:MAG: hypothetical protein ABIJ95_12055, partial [Pseudomonadota bacterium]
MAKKAKETADYADYGDFVKRRRAGFCVRPRGFGGTREDYLIKGIGLHPGEKLLIQAFPFFLMIFPYPFLCKGQDLMHTE